MKRTAEATAGIANMRSMGQVMRMYNQNNDEQFLNPFGVGRSVAPNSAFTIAPSTTMHGVEWDFYKPGLSGVPHRRVRKLLVQLPDRTRRSTAPAR